jgi:hypothetical protein
MSLGDSNADNNIPAQPFDANVAQQQAAASGRFSAEVMPNIGAPMTSFNASDFGAMAAGGPTGYDDPNSPARRLDKSKSIDQLMQSGVIQPIDNTNPVLARAGLDTNFNSTAPLAADQALKPGEAPQVTVTYADTNNGPNQQSPDFIVKQDGSIEAAGDPMAANKKDIVIQVERTPGSTADLAQSQQASVDGLVNYMYGRMSDNPAVAAKGLQLNDQFGLISNDVSQQVSRPDASETSAANTALARQNFAPQTQAAMAQASRFTPGSSGQFSRSDLNNYVPERSEPRATNETQSTANIKDAIAAEFRPDAATKENRNAPYETSRMDRVGAEVRPAVGRYGMSWSLFRGWFASNLGVDEDLTDDNISAKMDTLAKHGKVSKAFAAKFHDKAFAHKFVHAMHEMKDGHNPSAADMKALMPAQFQEQVAADMVGKYAKEAGMDSGKVALAFHLGKSPSELSTAELGDAGNKEYMSAAKKFGQLSHLRDGMGKDDVADYTVSKDGTMLDAKLRNSLLKTAERYGSTGKCAEAFQIGAAAAGFGEWLGTGDGWKMHTALDRDPKVVRVSREQALAAVQDGHVAFVTRHWTVDHNGKDSGHVEGLVKGSNGTVLGVSDHVSRHDPNNPRYNKDFYYLPKVDVQNA